MAYQEVRTFDGVGAAIRLLRRRLRLTQAELGRKLLVCRNTVNRYEHGMVNPSVHVLILLLPLAETLEERQPIAKLLRSHRFADFLQDLDQRAPSSTDIPVLVSTSDLNDNHGATEGACHD
jgi:transcriptional regulator with XRE-family HTH domain